MKMTPQHQEAIQALILFRGQENTASGKVAELLGVHYATVSKWRKDPEFSAELLRQLKEYRGNFDDVPLAHRKDRVQALESIFEKLTEKQVGLKIKVLQAIRQEVGDDKQVFEFHHTGHVGIDLPPRASSYEEWAEQNRLMDYRRGDNDGSVVDIAPVSVQTVRRDLPEGAVAAYQGDDPQSVENLYPMSEEREVG